MPTQPESLFDIIGGLREAVKKERADRDRAFIPDLNESICGVEVLPMTFGHLLKLSAVESPFVGPGIPSANAVMEFLWCLSPEYGSALRVKRAVSPWAPRLAGWLFRNAQRRFGRKLRVGRAFKEWVEGIRAYVKEAFEDGPKGSGDGGFHPSYFSGVALTIKVMCDDLNCSPSEVLAMPLKQFFQHQRRMMLRADPGAIVFNPSDEVRGAWLAKQNSDERRN